MRFLAFLFLVVVAGIGYLRLLFRVSRLEESRKFVEEYIRKFERFVETYRDEFDADLYHWLTHRVLRAQTLSSNAAVWESFDEKLQETATQKSAALVETLEQMGQHSVPTERVTTLTSFLMRFLGGLDDYLESIKRQQRNPLLLFRQGIQGILLAPATAVKWITGSDSSADELAAQTEIGRWTAFLSVIALIVPLIVVLVGWAPLAQIGSHATAAGNELVESLTETLREVSLPAETEEPLPVEPVTEPDLSTLE